MQLEIADLSDPRRARAVVDLLDMYSQNEFGSSQPLPAEVRERLVPGIRNHAGHLVFLAWDDDRPIGLAICFVGFSSFKAKPLINIHDLAVAPETRGRGVGRALLEAIEAEARRRDCCRVTLEVRSDNLVAQNLYRRLGYESSQPETWFWTRSLSE